MSSNPPVSSEAAGFVLRVPQQSPQPLGVTKLNKAIPKSAPFQKKQLPELLKQMVKSGQIVRTVPAPLPTGCRFMRNKAAHASLKRLRKGR